MNQCAECSVPIVSGQEKWVKHKQDGARVALCSDCATTLQTTKSDGSLLQRIEQSYQQEEAENSVPESSDILMSDWLRRLEVGDECTANSSKLTSSSIPSWLDTTIHVVMFLSSFTLVLLLGHIYNYGSGVFSSLLDSYPIIWWVLGVLAIFCFMPGFWGKLLLAWIRPRISSEFNHIPLFFIVDFMLIAMIVLILFVG